MTAILRRSFRFMIAASRGCLSSIVCMGSGHIVSIKFFASSRFFCPAVRSIYHIDVQVICCLRVICNASCIMQTAQCVVYHICKTHDDK